MGRCLIVAGRKSRGYWFLFIFAPAYVVAPTGNGSIVVVWSDMIVK